MIQGILADATAMAYIGDYFLPESTDVSGYLLTVGIASQSQYIKDVAAKFGVHFTVVKVGKYKSFTETYTLLAMEAR